VAHPLSYLALVTMATVHNPLVGQPLNRKSILDTWEASNGSRPSDYFSREKTLIGSGGCAFDRGGSFDRGDRGGGGASVVLSLLATL
jgi:hypothetical protein